MVCMSRFFLLSRHTYPAIKETNANLINPIIISDTSVHYFICMIRNGAHVVLTQMMSTHDAMVRDSLDFPNLIQLKDIKQNFRFDLEIYGMASVFFTYSGHHLVKNNTCNFHNLFSKNYYIFSR